MQDHRIKQQDVQIVVQRRLQTPEEVTVSFFFFSLTNVSWVEKFLPESRKSQRTPSAL